MPGTLYLVATPIGNLGDLTTRARDVLASVDFIVCEDTRHSRTLLDGLGIRKELLSLPAFAEGQRAEKIVSRLFEGQRCALITDAGSPAISDPGERLVAEALEHGVEVIPIPGPTALIAALSASGLPTGRFHFLGFLPRRGVDRRELLEEVSALAATLILYESPRRLPETLQDLLDAWGDRPACVARELTKLHEEFVRGSLSSLAARYRQQEVLGEVVVVVGGRQADRRWSEDELKTALVAGLERGEKLKTLASDLARRSGWVGSEVYRLGLSIRVRPSREPEE